VSGAKIQNEACRDNERAKDTEEQRLGRLEVEGLDGSDEKATMEILERTTKDAKVDVAVADALDEIRADNARRERLDAKCDVVTLAPSREIEDAEDAETARAVLGGRRGVHQGLNHLGNRSTWSSRCLGWRRRSRRISRRRWELGGR
jgi:hypothetical protein